MIRWRKTWSFSLYVAAAGLLLAMGAAARYANGGSGQPATERNAGQMGRGMMGQNRNRMAVRQRMRDLVDDLMENQAAMEKSRTVQSMKPLLKRNHELLETLNEDMARSWGMHGHMHGEAMGGRKGSSATAQPAGSGAAKTKASSAAQRELAATGKRIFLAKSCRICHGSEGTGTAAAPSLVGIGSKYSEEKIADLIRHPATSRMPPFSATALSDADLKAVIAYLETLKK